jgi:hypothetical protein
MFCFLPYEHETFYGCDLFYVVWWHLFMTDGFLCMTRLVRVGGFFVVIAGSWCYKIGMFPVCCVHWFLSIHLHMCFNG